MNSTITHLCCTHCGKLSQGGEARTVGGQWMTCLDCSGILDIQYDLEATGHAWKKNPLSERPLNHWRYHELLPLADDPTPRHWQVGWTPIVDTARLAQELGLRALCVKDDGRNPSGSLKDRASSVGVAHALQIGAETVACASTGNAATSLACHAALAGISAMIFVPHTAPEPKLAQMLVYGAKVFAVEGTYDQATQLCSTACERFGWYNRNCAINPVLIEGKKTAGLEIAEQSALRGEIPDWVAVSIGDGCTIAGIWKGLVEMRTLGMIDRLPRLLGVQAAGVAPIEYAMKHDALPEPGNGSTLADSIDVPVPRNWRKAVQALRASQGVVVCVTDAQILEAIRRGGKHGIFAEPAAAAALAGVIAGVESKLLGAQDSVLTMMTGTGLKDIRSSTRAGGEPIRISPCLDDVAAALDQAIKSGHQGKPTLFPPQ